MGLRNEEGDELTLKASTAGSLINALKVQDRTS